MNVEDIVKKYNSGLSIRQVASQVGYSSSKVRNLLIKQNVLMRSSRDGLVLRKRNSFPLSKEMLQIIEGEMLGDGCIIKGTSQSNFVFSNKYEDYVNWLASFFINNNITLVGSGIYKDTYYHKNWDKFYTRHTFSTLCSLEFENLEKRWYKNRIKVVPEDLEISPNLVLHWFLGDGSLPKKEFAIFCTDCFSYNEVFLLSKKLNDAINIKSSVMNTNIYTTKNKLRYRIFVPKTSVPSLLEYIGKPPFESLKYKWDLNKIGKINVPINIDIDYLKKLYFSDGLSIEKIAKFFNCSSGLIQKKLGQFKIRKRPVLLDKTLLNEIKKVFSVEKSLTEMSKILGCSAHTVSELIQYLNLPFRRKNSYKGKIHED